MDEMVGRHHRLNGHESEQTPGDSEGQGSLAGGHKRAGHDLATEQLNDVRIIYYSISLS